jgi:acyl-coenzyme A thioesterase PaaI-like protein
VDLTSLAIELLDRLPANRTLGLTIAEAVDGVGRAVLPVSEGVRNVIGALHSSGVAALADAAALAAVLSVAPDEALARRLQPLGTQASLTFQRPVRGTAFATCHLDVAGRSALAALFDGRDDRARFRTLTTIDGDEAPGAAAGEFDWLVRLAPG